MRASYTADAGKGLRLSEMCRIKPLAAGLKSWEPMLKNSMAFVTAEYLSTDEGKDFGEKYRNGKTTLEGNWNKYLEKWSEMITDGVYTKDM